MRDFLTNQFAQDFDVDQEPILTLGMPHVDGSFSLYAPNAAPWKQLILLSLVATAIQVCFACFIYEVIVKRRGTFGSYLIGWGFVIPLSLWFPFYLLGTLQIRQRVICSGPSSVMTVVFFRCIEAMYGTSPDVVEVSIWNYCSYYTNPAPYVWNRKPAKVQKITSTKLIRSFMERLFNFVALSIVLSLLMHFDFKPFEDRVEFTRFSLSKDFFSQGHLFNSYCLTILLYFTLNNLFEVNAFGENLKGLATHKIFDSPLTKSKTPTDFWAKRWNKHIHFILKRGIFQPIKKCSQDGKIAMFVTFVVSGLYHEYCYACIFHEQYSGGGTCLKDEECHEFKLGRLTAFFAYTGIVMLLERPLSKHPFFKWLSSVLPTIVIAQLLVLIHVPLVKWFGGDWVEGGFFDDLSTMTFLIRKT